MQVEVRDLPDIPAYLRGEISHFFDVYKELEPGKGSDVRGWQDRAPAEREIAAARERARGAAQAGRDLLHRAHHPDRPGT